MATKIKTVEAKAPKAPKAAAPKAAKAKAPKAAAPKKASKAKAEPVVLKAILNDAFGLTPAKKAKAPKKAKAVEVAVFIAPEADTSEMKLGLSSAPVAVVCENAPIVEPAKAKKAKASKKAKAVEPVAVEQAPAVEPAAEVDAEAVAADAVYAYAEKLGIDIADVVRIAKSCEEYDMLVGLAGMEITERVLWLASQKAREFDARVVRPNAKSVGSSLAGLSTAKAPKAPRAPKADGKPAGTPRQEVFGFAATAVIRALRATCGMTFAQIRNVMDAAGAEIVDGTIRAQMAGGGLGRGEPAKLTEEHIAKAKAMASAMPC